MNANDIAPCPFCGSSEIHPATTIDIRCECFGCGALGPEHGRFKDALAAWNRRVSTPADQALARVESELEVVASEALHTDNHLSAADRLRGMRLAGYIERIRAALKGEP